MLKRLIITNFALIQEMDVSFPGKLTVITGETGAGKSIFLEALGLALGKRADLSTLKNKEKKCIIEAEFDAEGLDLTAFFEEQQLENENPVVLRREISADGKSRSFLNDALINLSALKILSEKLIDIHSQHQTLLLNQSDFQLELVDAFAGSFKELKNYRENYRTLQEANRKLNLLQEQELQAKKEIDYLEYLFKELEESDIAPGLLKNYEEESATLENAEFIKSSLLQTANALNGGDQNLLSSLAQVKQTLQTLGKFGNTYQAFFTRLQSTYIELKELASELENAESEVHLDSAKLEEVNSKMDKLNRLLKKHNVNQEEELLKIKTEISDKLQGFSSLENEIVKTNKQVLDLTGACKKIAKELSSLRLAALPKIETEVQDLLSELSMENANFKIDAKTLSELGPNGCEQVRFLFSANLGSTPSELHKVASGGELSRLMLALKALLAEKKQLPTIIFDEIDTGVSGDVANKIGNILVKMGQNMQVISITHLPQIASKGKHHLFVYKKDEVDKTLSFIKELNKDERTVEIAKMLSTGKPTESAIKNALDLLKAN